MSGEMSTTEWRIEIIKRDLRIRELESAALQKLLGELEAEVSATPIPKPKKVKK